MNRMTVLAQSFDNLPVNVLIRQEVHPRLASNGIEDVRSERFGSEG